jgi:hypothetical protein
MRLPEISLGTRYGCKQYSRQPSHVGLFFVKRNGKEWLERTLPAAAGVQNDTALHQKFRQTVTLPPYDLLYDAPGVQALGSRVLSLRPSFLSVNRDASILHDLFP